MRYSKQKFILIELRIFVPTREVPYSYVRSSLIMKFAID